MRHRFAAVLLCLACSTQAHALDPPDQMLALYYAWNDVADECAGRSADISPELHDKVRTIAQAVERMVLDSRPEGEREPLKKKARGAADEMLAKMKRDADPAQGVCGNVKMVLASWAIYTKNLFQRLKENERLRSEDGAR